MARIPFIENFGGAHMHSFSEMCHCLLPGSCQWWPLGLPFACATHQVKTIMLVAKLGGATRAGRTADPEHHDIYLIMFTAVTCVLYTVFDIC